MGSAIDQAKLKVGSWTEKHRHAVLYDEEKSLLLDVASGKSTSLAWCDVKGFDEKIHPETEDYYLVLLFENGNQLALVDPGGVAFAPSVANSPVRGLPAVVCLRDFYTLKQRIDHHL